MFAHPDDQFSMAEQRLADLRSEAAAERRAAHARRAAPDFVPTSRWRDPAFWASLCGPIIGFGFLAYFISEIARAVQ